MGSFSVWHWLIVLLIVVLVFGTKKLKNMGSDERRPGRSAAGQHPQGGSRPEHGRRRGEDATLIAPQRPA